MAKLFSVRNKGSAQEPGKPSDRAQGSPENDGGDADFPERSRFVRANESRLVNTSVGWFALTRDEDDLGPFATELQAEAALRDYLQTVQPRESREFSPVLSSGVLLHDTETCKKRHCAFCIEAGVLAEDNWSELISQIDFVTGDIEL
ncbi:hypothetical protein [Marinobacter shengliensis]|jgi:hypothetical protein|uniref:hypothetical protein n=1 Tax=Marinobacter shengliensis TaxID=1389223 RepID=UPI002573EB13|nr:hypothetical protein [Marinobacter shengliensis]BEH15181.1 hypothetical protein MAALD49_25490 [Marinobacter shengliensis]